MKDLLILAADADIDATMDVLLKKRQPSLGIRCIEFKIVRHLKKDSGCRKFAADTARTYVNDYKYAVLFDKDGCGDEGTERQLIQCAVEKDLGQTGWGNRSKAIVIEPELEMWVWSESPNVDKVLGWKDGTGHMREWLREHGLWPDDKAKPPDPKLALKLAMRERKLSPTAATFMELAEKVSLRKCKDPAFLEVRETLQRWFPAPESGF